VLGRANGDKIDGVRLVGAMPYAMFEAKLDEMLKQESVK
jgi:hypothetical protein